MGKSEREREGREGGKSGDLRIINEDTSPFRRLALLPSYKYLLRNANVLKKNKKLNGVAVTRGGCLCLSITITSLRFFQILN